MRKQTKKQLKEFNNEIIEMLTYYGATKVDERTYSMDSDKIGKLYIILDLTPSTVYTVYARFEEEKACKYFNVSPYSLKLNTHEYSPDPCLYHIDSLLDNYNQINGIDSHKEYNESVEAKIKEATK